MNLKAPGIYFIEHMASGKRYVGSAVNLERRFKRHLTLLRKGAHHSCKLQEAWDEFGEGAFEFNVLYRCSEDRLLGLEQKVMDEWNVFMTGYNVAIFSASPHKGRHHSAETKVKMSASAKHRKPISEETRQRLKDAAVERERMKKEAGYRVSDETRVKLSAALKGREVSEETRGKISAANTGRPRSVEHTQKLSDARRAREGSSVAEIAGRILAASKNRGKKRSNEFREMMSVLASNRTEEHQAKLTAAMVGKNPSEETRARMSASRREYVESKLIADLAGVS